MNDGKKRKGQKHQYKTAFKIQFDPLALEIHKKVSLRGLCKRCAEQIQWRMQFNKYKKMTEAAKCTYCHQKNVFRSYMRACEPCTQEKNVCPKCLSSETEEQIETRLNEAEQKKQDQQAEKNMNDFLKKLKERSRRTVKRHYEKGTIEWNNELLIFTDTEGNAFPVQFKQGFGDAASRQGESDDDDDYDICDEEGNESDIDSEEEQQEEVHIKKATKKSRKQSSEPGAQKSQEENDSGEEEQIQKQGEPEQQQQEQELNAAESNKEEEVSQESEKEGGLAELKYADEGGDWQDIEEDTQDLGQTTAKSRGPKRRKSKK